jgi:hypothetical protein
MRPSNLLLEVHVGCSRISGRTICLGTEVEARQEGAPLGSIDLLFSYIILGECK